MHREKLDLTYARWKEGRFEGEVDLVLIDDKKYKSCLLSNNRFDGYERLKPNKNDSIFYYTIRIYGNEKIKVKNELLSELLNKIEIEEKDYLDQNDINNIVYFFDSQFGDNFSKNN
jgi:hypothetical protein